MLKKNLKKIKLTLLALLAVITAIIFFMSSYKRKMTALLTEISLQNITETQELYAHSLKNTFNSFFRLLEIHASYFKDIDLNDTQEIKKRAALIKDTGSFNRTAVVNQNGFAVDFNGKNLPNMKNKSYFLNTILKNKIQISEKIELDEKLNPNIIITFPFKTISGQKGAIAGFFSYEILLELFSTPIFGGKSYFYLITPDGNIILHNKFKNKLIYNVNVYDYINNASGYDNEPLKKLQIDMLNSSSGHMTLDGVEGKKLFVYAPLNIYGWYIMSVLPYSYINEQQKKISLLVYILIAAIGASVFFTLAIIYIIIKNSLRIKKDNERLTIASNQAQTLIFEYDFINNKVDFSGDTLFILGNDKKTYGMDFIRSQYYTRIHPEDFNVISGLKENLDDNKKTISAEFRYRSFNDEWIWVKITVSSVISGQGTLEKYIGSITNVNSQVLHEQELRNIADRDRLSYLLNKTAMEREVKQYLSTDGKNRYSALIIIDLDNFKDVNDRLGHMTGDLAIKDAAKKISLIFSNKDYLGRFGGDEFCILMRFNESLSKENILKIINVKAADLCKFLKEDYSNGDKKVTITSSIGIAVYPENGSTYEELFKNADSALYDVKQNGKNAYKIFS